MAKLVKKKIIIVDNTGRNNLMLRFGCCRATVMNALGYYSNSSLAQDIRQAALEKEGGQVTTKSILIRA